jgi:hypothetical protein
MDRIAGPSRSGGAKEQPASDGMQTIGAFVQALTALGRQQPEAESGSSTAVPPAANSDVASAPPEVAAAFLARPTYTFDRTRVSTATDTLGETKGVTDNQLILDKKDPERAQESVRTELGRQDAAQQDSESRADQARGTLDRSRGREQQLANQRRELQTVQTARNTDAQESNRQVMSDSERLEQHARTIQATQNAGEQSLARINLLDGQVQQNAAARDQASNDVRTSQQSIASLQNQVQQLQQQKPPETQGSSNKPPQSNGNAPAPAGPPPKKDSTWAAARQQALTSTQSQLTAAQKQQEEARKRQEQAQQALQTNQQAAQGERKNLEQTRGQLERSVQARRVSQDRAQSNKQQMQVDADGLKDLAAQTRDLNSQSDEIDEGRERAQVSLERNLANAAAAKQNVAQLRALSGQLERPPEPADEPPTRRSIKPQGARPGTAREGHLQSAESISPEGVDVARTPGAAEPVRAENSTRPLQDTTPRNGSGPEVQDRGKNLFVRLQSLNQGANGASIDSGGGLTRHRSGGGSADAASDAQLAAANAAANPVGAAAGSSSESLRSGPPGLAKKDDDGGGPGRGNGNGGGNGNGRGRG